MGADICPGSLAPAVVPRGEIVWGQTAKRDTLGPKAAASSARSRLDSADGASTIVSSTGSSQALQARETRRKALEAQREGMRVDRRLRASDADRVRDELVTLAGSWRQVLADDPTHARPIVSSLLKGRVTITPTEARKRWTLSGDSPLVGLFERIVIPGLWRKVPPSLASPTGLVTCYPTELEGIWVSDRRAA